MNSVESTIHKAMLEMLKKFNNRLNKSQMEPEDKLSSWAQFLAFEKKCTVKQVAVALDGLMNESTKFMPSAYEIAAALKPKESSSEDIGNQVANEIIQAVVDWGVYRLGDAYASLSPVAKRTLGGNTYILREIANSEQDQIPSIRAQIRGMVKASAEAIKNDKHNQKLNSIGIDNGHSVSSIKSEIQALEYSSFLPEGA